MTPDAEAGALVTTLMEAYTREMKLVWEAIADVRDGLVDLDHAKAPAARLDELEHGVRVLDSDARQATLYWINTRDMHLTLAEEVAALRDDFSVLRNDYRGEGEAS